MYVLYCFIIDIVDWEPPGVRYKMGIYSKLLNKINKINSVTHSNISPEEKFHLRSKLWCQFWQFLAHSRGEACHGICKEPHFPLEISLCNTSANIHWCWQKWTNNDMSFRKNFWSLRFLWSLNSLYSNIFERTVGNFVIKKGYES